TISFTGTQATERAEGRGSYSGIVVQLAKPHRAICHLLTGFKITLRGHSGDRTINHGQYE
ncbi:uncharacterized, partial [Tachysurus ichikawai]